MEESRDIFFKKDTLICTNIKELYKKSVKVVTTLRQEDWAKNGIK